MFRIKAYASFLFGLLLLLLVNPATVHATPSRAELLEIPVVNPFTLEQKKTWQPWVNTLGTKVWSSWQQGLYQHAIGQPEKARTWWLKAAVKGDTPSQDALCLAFKLADAKLATTSSNITLTTHQKAEQIHDIIQQWILSAAEKIDRKRALSPEEKAAWAALKTLPEDEQEQATMIHQKEVVCRNLTNSPDPTPLFRAALSADKPLSGDMFNALGVAAEHAQQWQQALFFYEKGRAAQNLAAGTNWVRLFERQQRLEVGAKDWEKVLVSYRQQAEKGDGSAMVYLGDLMERGSTGVQNVDLALSLYQRGIDALNQPNADGGMAAVMLILYAQERITEHYKMGRIAFSNSQERKKYLTLKEALSEPQAK